MAPSAGNFSKIFFKKSVCLIPFKFSQTSDIQASDLIYIAIIILYMSSKAPPPLKQKNLYDFSENPSFILKVYTHNEIAEDGITNNFI